MGILPGGLTHNSGGKYLDRWVDLEVKNNKSPWLKNIKKISLPIAHGEGRYVIGENYQKLKKSNQIALTYAKGEICKFQNLKANPNGSEHDIAGVLGYNGRVFGLMPHPERAMFLHHRPDWYFQKSKQQKDIGAGLQIFKNAVNYFKNK